MNADHHEGIGSRVPQRITNGTGRGASHFRRVPLYNEELNVEEPYDRMRNVVTDAVSELIVVVDAGIFGTFERLARIIRLRRNLGLTAARSA